MKFCWKAETILTHLKIICFHISIAFILWTCCCYQGNESRPVSVSHVTPITCHGIFEKSHRHHVTKSCSCKCWIWCKSSTTCLEWRLSAQTQLLQPQLPKEYHIYKTLATACKDCCDKGSNSPILYEIPHLDFKCNRSNFNRNSSYCDTTHHTIPDWCCSVYCSDKQNIGSCFYLYPNASITDFSTSNSIKKTSYFLSLIHTNESTFLKRNKRNREFQLPYHIKILDNLNEFMVHQPFNVKIQLANVQGAVVPESGQKIQLRLVPPKHNLGKYKNEEFKAIFRDGLATFSNVSFKEAGKNFRLSITSQNSSEIRPWQSEKLTVNYRPLTLRSSGRNLPISPKENDTLSPAAGVIIYDEINNRPASKSYLSQFVWECTVSLLYDDVYPGQLLGTTSKIIEDGSNEIIFDDVVISEWGYAYILKIEVKSKDTSNWNLTHLIGPFDVDKFDTFEMPLVESHEFRNLKIVFDNQYNIVRRNEEKFKIFFLNQFGIQYSTVRWKDVVLSEGSIIVDSIITGLTEHLEKMSRELEEAIESDKADVVYEGNVLKTNKIFLPSRKLLEESNTESSEDGAGGLSVAWIVAIVVNVILIIVFIIAIIYCYCRRKKNRDVSSSASSVHNFDGGPNPILYGNKAEQLQEKAAIFTIEDNHAKLGNHRSSSGKLHRKGERCNCQSPTCYCSTGDGRKTDTTLRLYEEENENDPQGYPTPSPEPKFPTPQPEPEEFWRPDSYDQQEEQEEEEEEMFLPGAVSEPSPEPPREERFYVYLLTDIDGSRELVGQIYLRVDNTLAEVRREIDRDRDLSEMIEGREYRFLNENLDVIRNYHESSASLENVFPAQGINIQYIPQKAPTPKPAPPPKPKLPAYVGPLGICSAADCSKAAKIKCLDCRNVAYCSKKCMRDDAKDHRKVCFKPAWRL